MYMPFGKHKGKPISEVSIQKSWERAPMQCKEKIDLLYQAYPRKMGKGAASKAIEKALKKVSFETLKGAVEEYAAACKASGLEREFIPYPATWFNQERWDDDRQEWWRSARLKTIADHNADSFREVFGD
jgi:hypothetical protein